MPTGTASRGGLSDARRHLGVLPADPFHGRPPVAPDTTAVPAAGALLREVDAGGTERALVLPGHGHAELVVSSSLDRAAAGERPCTDPSWSIGSAPRRPAAQVERRGTGRDRVPAGDEPCGDAAGGCGACAAPPATVSRPAPGPPRASLPSTAERAPPHLLHRTGPTHRLRSPR